MLYLSYSMWANILRNREWIHFTVNPFFFAIRFGILHLCNCKYLCAVKFWWFLQVNEFIKFSKIWCNIYGTLVPYIGRCEQNNSKPISAQYYFNCLRWNTRMWARLYSVFVWKDWSIFPSCSLSLVIYMNSFIIILFISTTTS